MSKDELLKLTALVAAFFLIPMNLIIVHTVYMKSVSNTLDGLDGGVSAIITVLDMAYLYAVYEANKQDVE